MKTPTKKDGKGKAEDKTPPQKVDRLKRIQKTKRDNFLKKLGFNPKSRSIRIREALLKKLPKDLKEVVKVALEESTLEVIPESEFLKQSEKPTKVGGKPIWQGGRPRWMPGFPDTFWSRPKNRRCRKCNTPCVKGHRGIDHKTPWHPYIVSKANAVMVCKDGRHWEVYLSSDVIKYYHDEDNLQPMCKKHNSEKGGAKGLDYFQPTLMAKEICMGARCGLPKAT